MSDFIILAFGKIKGSDFDELSKLYTKRILWPLTITELTSKKNLKNQALKEDEAMILRTHLQDKDYVIALDERGKNIGSVNIAEKINQCQITQKGRIVFIIGGADGLASTIRDRADFLLSFGAQTWPHMMVRIMLLEQIYRAQQILAGHPYHRA